MSNNKQISSINVWRIIIILIVTIVPVIFLIRVFENPGTIFSFFGVTIVCIILGSFFCENLWTRQ